MQPIEILGFNQNFPMELFYCNRGLSKAKGEKVRNQSFQCRLWILVSDQNSIKKQARS